MGKGVIVSGGTDGNYTIKIEFDRRRVDAKIAAIDARLGSDLEVTQALAALLQAENELNALLAELDQTINGWEALQNWIPGTDYPRGIADGNAVLIQIGISAITAQPGRSGDDEPLWDSINHGETLRDNEVVWSMSIRDPEGGAFWSPSTDYAVDDEVLAISNIIVEMLPKNVYATATKAGRSGFSQPSWPNSGSVIEGGIIWQKRDQIPALSELVLRVGTASQARDDARDKYDTIRLEREELRREKAYLESNMPDDPEVQAWCADVTENFAVDDEVGTMEIPGERNGVPVLVRPGHVDESQMMPGAVYDHIRDGQIQPSIASTSAGVFWNLAILPAWQRWRPQYRIGSIVAIDYVQQQASVQIVAATSSQQDLNVNDPGAIPLLFDVPVRYMTCNAAAFVEGDRVIVEFEDRDWTKPRVIGFESNPKRCPVGQFTFIYNTGPGMNDDRLFRGAPGNWTDFDLEDGQATILNGTTRLSLWASLDKEIILTASPNNEIHMGVDRVARTPNLALACGLNEHQDKSTWLRCVAFGNNTISSYEKPWPVSDANSTAIFDQGVYDGLVAAMDEAGAALEWAKWHLIGATTIGAITGGPDPDVVRFGSINADGDEAAIMLGYIYPEIYTDAFLQQHESEWHGYIKIDLDSYGVSIFPQMLTGNNAIHTDWSIISTFNTESLPTSYLAATCTTRQKTESASSNYSKIDVQDARLIIDLAYDGNTLMLGELHIEYNWNDTSTGSFSTITTGHYLPNEQEDTCFINSTTASGNASTDRSQVQTWKHTLSIRPEGGGNAQLELIVEDYSHTLTVSGSASENNGVVTGGQTVTQTGGGTLGYIEYFSVLHRAAIVRKFTKTDSSAEDDLLVMHVPGKEQELCDVTIAAAPNLPIAPGSTQGFVSGSLNRYGVQFVFAPVPLGVTGPGGQIIESFSVSDGASVDTEIVASHYPNDAKNYQDWADASLDANVRYFNGSNMYSIYKLEPQVWPATSLSRFDTTVRYTHLTGGDPAALLEADGDVVLQQIGIL